MKASKSLTAVDARHTTSSSGFETLEVISTRNKLLFHYACCHWSAADASSIKFVPFPPLVFRKALYYSYLYNCKYLLVSH